MFGLVWLRHGLRQSQAGLAHPKQLRMTLNTCLHLALWLASPTQAEESMRYTRDQYFSKLFYNTQKQYKTPNTLPCPCVPRQNTYCKHNARVHQHTPTQAHTHKTRLHNILATYTNILKPTYTHKNIPPHKHTHTPTYQPPTHTNIPSR